jgi:hypothetical protein
MGTVMSETSGGAEEFIQQRRIPQPKPGHNHNWHHDLPWLDTQPADAR